MRVTGGEGRVTGGEGVRSRAHNGLPSVLEGRRRAAVGAPRPGAPRATWSGARADARVRRHRRARRLAGLARFALFLFLIFAAVWAGVRVANATDESAMLSGRTYEVRAGDTLWQIATEQYDGTLDPRAVVYEIREENNLDGALLQPGATLTLPYIEP